MAYSLQAEYGDFVDFETTAHVWRERPMVSTSATGGVIELSSLEHIDDIIWGYCQLRGVSQDNAIWYYLDEIRRLSSYGVQLFYGSTASGEAAQLGVSRNGLTISTICAINPIVSKYKWEDIKDLAYSRKTFTIQLLKKAKPIHFVFEDTQDARYLWNFCIQMHNSYIHYWTHVKAGPTAHLSDPPDILRGNGCSLPTPTSSPSCDFGGTSPHFSSKGGSETSGVVVNNSNSTTTIGSVASMHATIGQGGNNSLTSLQQSHTNHPISSSLPVCGSGENERDPMQTHDHSTLTVALSYNIQEDSEGGTLVDTLDSQMLANRCVTCLPVTACLRRGTTPKSGDSCPSTGSIQAPQSQSSSITSPRKRHHHHHKKHRVQPIAMSGATSAQEAAARYNMSLAESSSGSSSESEFESDMCSTSAETSSSSNSSRRGDDEVDTQDQHHGFRRLLGASNIGTGAGVSLRPILSGFNQHHYRLQQNWRDETNVSPDNRRNSPARQFSGTPDVKPVTGESHGWLASAKRLTSALSESLTRRALSSNPSTSNKPSPATTPQLLSRGPKSIGIAQVIRPEPPSTHSLESGGGNNFEDSRQRPSRPPIPPGGTPSRHPGLSCNPNAPYRGASAGPTTSGTTSTNIPPSTSSYPLHHSLYEVPPEGRLRIRLQPPSPPSSQEETSWRLVQHPGVWINQLNTSDCQQGQQQRGYYDGDMIAPPLSSQQAMTSSSMTSSSTSTSTSSAGVVAAVQAAAAATNRSNSSSPSSPASSIVEDEMMMMIMMRAGVDKEDDSSSTMSYSACGGGEIRDSRTSGKTAAVVTPIQKQSPPQQQRQRSLSGSGGPLHLLTNSDIHQLLNLTKMRETALVHRLLAEYRQTLLLQQSLHANSMSTPNLAASQELQTSATNNNGVESFTNGTYSNTGPNVAAPQVEGACRPQRTSIQRRNESYGPGGSCHDCFRGKQASRCAHQNARGPHASDSSDYVNACAFQCSHGCSCGVNHMQTSVHSTTTDNDSNATFRVLSEVDGARGGHCSNNHQHSHQHSGHTHHHHQNQKRHHHHHEDSCTTNSDLMTSSNCSQSGGWGAVSKSNSFHHQPQRIGGGGGDYGAGGGKINGRTRYAHEACKSSNPSNCHRQFEKCGSPAKVELPEIETPLRGSPPDRHVGGENNSGNGFSRSKTFANSPQSQTGTPRVAFMHSYDRSCGSGANGSGQFHAGEYENLENESPLFSSINRKSTTDVSVRSSSSDISYEDYKFIQRLQRRTRAPTTPFGDIHERHHHCPHHRNGICHYNWPGPTSSGKRSTLLSNSCDGGGGQVQLCWEHMRALEQLGASKEVHIDTPMIQRRKHKKKTRNVEMEPCCSHCSIQQNQRHAEKARSFDPYKRKSALRHRCSASPVFSVEPAETQCDLCRRQRRWGTGFRRPKCECDGSGDGCSDEDLGEFSSSRAASDSSLASSALPGTRDTASIMVSSYEFECQQQQPQYNSGPSFENVNGGGSGSSSRKSKNKPPTPKYLDERRGSTGRLQPHVNFYEERQSTPVRNSGKTLQNSSTARKASLSPPSLDRLLQRPERPKTLLSSSASFQVEDRHYRHPPSDKASMRYTNRLLGNPSGRGGTPVGRTEGLVEYSRTPTLTRTMGTHQMPIGGGTGGCGSLFTASMTFTPSTNTNTLSPEPLNSNKVTGGRTDHQPQNQNDSQRSLPYKSASVLSHRDKEERAYLFSKKSQTPTEKRTPNAML